MIQTVKETFDLDILIKLGNYHKKLMKQLEDLIDKFETDKDIYEYVNKYLKQNNLSKAFPIGISINHIIAHDSFYEFDIKRLKKGDFIKIDVGIIELGNIIDSARTFVYKSKVPQCIIDCKIIANFIEESISKDVIENKPILIQKISALTNALITMKGYHALDYLGGHTIEYGKVHGKHLILNKPLKLLPKEAEMFIDPNATIGEGEMFAIEIYIGEKKSSGNMIKSSTINITHYQINNQMDLDKISKLKSDEKEVFDKIKKDTNNLVYDYTEHSKYYSKIITKLINYNYIIKHEALEFKSDTKEKIKYIQYEDCFIIFNNQLYNLTK
jgi:methionyl aminopeptidase